MGVGVEVGLASAVEVISATTVARALGVAVGIGVTVGCASAVAVISATTDNVLNSNAKIRNTRTYSGTRLCKNCVPAC